MYWPRNDSDLNCAGCGSFGLEFVAVAAATTADSVL